MTEYVTVKDVLASAEKWGEDNVLTWSPKNTKDQIADNKNTAKKPFDCAWAYLNFKKANGVEVKANIKFMKVVSSSQAKAPTFKDNDTKKISVCFSRVTREDIIKSGYNDVKLIDQLVENTNEFERMIQILNKSYAKICGEIKACKTLHFSIRKDKKIKTNNDVNVCSITQHFREDKDSGPDADPIKLDVPITRINLLVRKEDGLIGISKKNNVTKQIEFNPNVYDAKKSNKKNNYAPVLATIKEDGKILPLHKDNAYKFLTYRSIYNGFVKFTDVTISKVGMSFGHHFGNIFVKSNESLDSEATLSKKDIIDFIGSDEEESDPDEISPSTENTHKSTELDTIGSKLEDTKITENKIESDLEDDDDDSNLESDCEE